MKKHLSHLGFLVLMLSLVNNHLRASFEVFFKDFAVIKEQTAACMKAIKEKNFKEMDRLLATGEVDVNSQQFSSKEGVGGQTMLMMVLRETRVVPAVVKALMKAGTNIDLTDKEGRTVLSLTHAPILNDIIKNELEKRAQK